MEPPAGLRSARARTIHDGAPDRTHVADARHAPPGHGARRSELASALPGHGRAAVPARRPVRTKTQWARARTGPGGGPPDNGRAAADRQRARPVAGERWPDWDVESLAYAVRYLVPLVQVTPRGVWGATGSPRSPRWRHGSAGRWIRTLDRRAAAPLPRGSTARRASMDARSWSGLARLGEVVERLRPQLVTFRDDRGRELFDLPDAPRPDPDTPAPFRFLPEYDNVLLGFADRRRFVPDEYRTRVFVTELTVGSFLIDGLVAGAWHSRRDEGNGHPEGGARASRSAAANAPRSATRRNVSCNLSARAPRATRWFSPKPCSGAVSARRRMPRGSAARRRARRRSLRCRGRAARRRGRPVPRR